MENRIVMKRFEERRDLIIKEVKEVRSLPWRPAGEEEVEVDDKATVNGTTANATDSAASNGTNTASANGTAAPVQNGDEEDGVYL